MVRRTTSLLGIAAFALSICACSKSDPGITKEVRTKLAADDTVKAYKIDVETSKTVVTLTGTIDSPSARIRAFELARATTGVTGVVDQLILTPPAVATSGVKAPNTQPKP